MSRSTPRHRKDNKESNIIKGFLIIVIMFILSAIVIFTPVGNNQLRNIPTRKDTPMDSIAKGVLISQINKSEGIKEVDPSILELRNLLLNSSIKEIVSLNNDKTKVVLFIKEKVGVNDESAHIIASALLSNEITLDMMKNVKGSRWIRFYKGFNDLQSSGELITMKEKISKSQDSDAKDLQSEASDLLNNRD